MKLMSTLNRLRIFNQGADINFINLTPYNVQLPRQDR
jgi:hypothetical protein